MTDFKAGCRFIDALVYAFQSYGVSSRAMVVALSRVARALGLNGEFVATPNYVQTVLWAQEDPSEQQVHLVVTRSGNYDLARLTRVTKLTQQVEARSLSPCEALVGLQEIARAPDAYGPWHAALAFVLCGASFAVLISASWMDTLMGGVVALASYGITLLSARSAGIAALQELIAAMIAAILANVSAVILPGLNPMAVTVCAVIVFVPGFGLTVAPSELMVGNTLSGIVWLTNALVVTFKLFFGAAIGVALAHGAGVNVQSIAPAGGIASPWKWGAVPILIMSLAVVMRAERRQFWAIVPGGWLVWGAVQAGSPFGFWQGTFLGSTVLMIYAHWYGRHFGVPTVVILLPCVMVLVPGLAALRALHEADMEGILAGLRASYEVLILIAAIIGGTLAGDALALHNLAKRGKAMRSLIAKSTGLGRDDLE